MKGAQGTGGKSVARFPSNIVVAGTCDASLLLAILLLPTWVSKSTVVVTGPNSAREKVRWL